MRDYYRVETDEAGRFWLFRDAPADRGRALVAARGVRMSYAELQVTTHFSFLRGASSPRELFEQAKLLGLPALGVTDRNSLAGIVRAHEAAKETGVRLVVGCRLDLADGPSLLVYPTDRAAYSRLCRLLSLGKGRAGKGKCRLAWEDVAPGARASSPSCSATMPDEAPERRPGAAAGAPSATAAYMALIRRFAPNEHLRLQAVEAGRRRRPGADGRDGRRALPSSEPAHAAGRGHLHPAQDAPSTQAGFRLERHADRYLKDPDEMARLFERHPDAVARTLEIVGALPLLPRRAALPVPDRDHRRRRDRAGDPRAPDLGGRAQPLSRRPAGRVAAQIRHELTLIEELRLRALLPDRQLDRPLRPLDGASCARAAARPRTPPSASCSASPRSTRSGQSSCSSASSAEERSEPPDIDVDFEHERREEVIQWIYDTYGRHRAAL